VAQPGPADPIVLPFAPLHEHLHGRRTGPDQPVAHAPAKAASPGHQVQGFEQAGLAGAVVAGDQVQARLRRKFNLREAA
jgi:hypothetical protein